MSPTRLLSTLLVVAATLIALTGPVAGQESQPDAPDTPISTAFTYQGSLRSGSSPASGPHDFQFIIYNAASGGSQVGATLTRDDISISGGIFTVELDFGATAFDGQARWLEVGVRPGSSSGDYSILSPRHPLTAVPYALYATKAPWSGLQSVPAGFADGVDDNTTYSAGTGLTLAGTTFAADTGYLQRRVSDTCAAGSAIRVVNADGSVTCETDDNTTYGAGTGLTLTGTTFAADIGYLQRRVSDTCTAGSAIRVVNADGSVTCETDDNTTYSAGTGLTLTGAVFAANTAYLQRRVSDMCAAGSAIRVVNADGSVTCETDDAGWSLTGNAGTTPGANFLGTTDNTALELKINNQRALRLEPASWGMQSGNTSAPSTGPFSAASAPSTVYGTNVIAGYSSNSVTAGYLSQTIAGGGSNALECGASGNDPCTNTVTANYGTVGGGGGNTASWTATVGGGGRNIAGGWASTIAGGYINTAGGGASTIAGGEQNTASDDNTTVAGGFGNTASGANATVAGGTFNTASGAWSFAAGRRAKATTQGSFVWADSADTDFTAYAQDSFNVRAGGGASITAKYAYWGLRVDNYADDTPTDNGDGIDIYANISRGNYWAALYAINYSTSPAIYASSNGTYSGYFEDNIYVVGNCVGCTLAYVAINSGSEALQVGDVVAADGVRPPLTSGGQPLLAVHRATAGAVGVVARRAALVESSKDDKTTISAEAADGPIAAGDHLFIIVSGVAQARVDAAGGPITAGQRLTTASTAGYARGLRTVSVEGVPVAEAAPVVGVALEGLPAGRGLIWVLVTIR